MTQIIDKAEEERISELIEKQKRYNVARRIDRQNRSKWLADKTLIEVIHHPARPRDSQCLYGVPAWDEFVYI